MLTKDIKLKVELRIKELIHKFNERFPNSRMNMPLITYNVRGTCAGKAHYGRYQIDLNPVLLVENLETFIHDTVAHELAHLATDHITNRLAKAHGREWKSMMVFFGVYPRARHDYDVTNARVRHVKRVAYKCDCRTHMLAMVQHNRIVSGRTYHCRVCKTQLVRGEYE